MLKELFFEIERAGYISKSSLASKFQQPIGLIEDGIAQLIRLGYLREGKKQPDFDCELPCGRCPYAALCNQAPVETVSITEKGQQFLEKHKKS